MMRHCKVMWASVLIVALGLMCTPDGLAQRYVDVPAGYGTLQTVLRADSANRVATPNTVYRLHRGTADSVYYLTETLTRWGSMPLRIESVGSGVLPRLIAATQSDGSAISPIISARANFSMKGVFIDGVNTLGAPIDRMIRIQSNGVRLELDSCEANVSSQSFIRVDNATSGIFLKNCRVSNVFSDWSNARGIDNRGITIDTVSMMGCSFYRIGQRVYRDGGGILKYAYFNHNTFTETGSTLLSLGSTQNLVYINNLAVNCGFLGTGITPPDGRLISITPLPTGQSAYITKNVFHSDSAALIAAYRASTDTVVLQAWFADTLLTFISNAGLGSTNISSPVTFTRSPGNTPGAVKVDSIARWYWKDPATASTNASILKVDSIKLVNLAYNTNAPAYTFSTDGKPSGAPNWFGLTVGVNAPENVGVPDGFALLQNYPNPFNPETVIRYLVSGLSDVRLIVYDVLGREVAALVNEQQNPGTYEVVFDATGLSSGVYLYRLTAGGFADVKKMAVVK